MKKVVFILIAFLTLSVSAQQKTFNSNVKVNGQLKVKNPSPLIKLENNENTGTITISSLTSDRTYTLPDASGVIALEGGSSVPNLQAVTTEGGTTNQAVTVNNVLSSNSLAVTSSITASTVTCATGQIQAKIIKAAGSGPTYPVIQLNDTNAGGGSTYIRRHNQSGNFDITLPTEDGQLALVSNSIKTASISFTSAELLSSTGKTVASTAVGEFIDVLSVTYEYTHNGDTYDPSCSIDIGYDGASSNLCSSVGFGDLAFGSSNTMKRVNISSSGDVSRTANLLINTSGFANGNGEIKIIITYKVVQ